VIAEGVETQAQLAFLADTGCEEIQGYLLSRPLDEKAMTSFVEREGRVLVPAREIGVALHAPQAPRG
jgi:EAL domain-containing protein (putative c-di-GMP-specific phosphodiesterase class I)